MNANETYVRVGDAYRPTGIWACGRCGEIHTVGTGPVQVISEHSKEMARQCCDYHCPTCGMRVETQYSWYCPACRRQKEAEAAAPLRYAFCFEVPAVARFTVVAEDDRAATVRAKEIVRFLASGMMAEDLGDEDDGEVVCDPAAEPRRAT